MDVEKEKRLKVGAEIHFAVIFCSTYFLGMVALVWSRGLLLRIKEHVYKVDHFLRFVNCVATETFCHHFSKLKQQQETKYNQQLKIFTNIFSGPE